MRQLKLKDHVIEGDSVTFSRERLHKNYFLVTVELDDGDGNLEENVGAIAIKRIPAIQAWLTKVMEEAKK